MFLQKKPLFLGFWVNCESRDVFCNITFQSSCSAVSHKHHIGLGHDMATRCQQPFPYVDKWSLSHAENWDLTWCWIFAHLVIKVKQEAKIVSNTAFLKKASTWAIAVAGRGKFSSYCQEQSRDPCYENKPKTPVLLVYCSCQISKTLCLHPTHSLYPLSPRIEI